MARKPGSGSFSFVENGIEILRIFVEEETKALVSNCNPATAVAFNRTALRMKVNANTGSKVGSTARRAVLVLSLLWKMLPPKERPELHRMSCLHRDFSETAIRNLPLFLKRRLVTEFDVVYVKGIAQISPKMKIRASPTRSIPNPEPVPEPILGPSNIPETTLGPETTPEHEAAPGPVYTWVDWLGALPPQKVTVAVDPAPVTSGGAPDVPNFERMIRSTLTPALEAHLEKIDSLFDSKAVFITEFIEELFKNSQRAKLATPPTMIGPGNFPPDQKPPFSDTYTPTTVPPHLFNKVDPLASEGRKEIPSEGLPNDTTPSLNPRKLSPREILESLPKTGLITEIPQSIQLKSRKIRVLLVNLSSNMLKKVEACPQLDTHIVDARYPEKKSNLSSYKDCDYVVVDTYHHGGLSSTGSSNVYKTFGKGNVKQVTTTSSLDRVLHEILSAPSNVQ